MQEQPEIRMNYNRIVFIVINIINSDFQVFFGVVESEPVGFAVCAANRGRR